MKFLEKYGAALKGYKPTDKKRYVSETQHLDAEPLSVWIRQHRYKRDSTRSIQTDMVRAMYMIKYGGIKYQWLMPLVADDWYYKTISGWITDENWAYSTTTQAITWDGLDGSYTDARLFFIVNEREWLQRNSSTAYEKFFSTVPPDVWKAKVDERKEMLQKFFLCDMNIAKKKADKAAEACHALQKTDAESDSTLRPYQQQAIRDILDAWQKVQSVMLQMPTGTGKTRLFVSLIAAIQQSHQAINATPRFLIVTHREELVEQISETLHRYYRLHHGVLQGESTRALDSNIIVASIQTLISRLKGHSPSLLSWEKPENKTFIIIDEAHHSVAKTYTKLWETFPEAYKLGVTATPYRMGKTAFTAHYDHLIQSQSIRHFIRQGWLSDYSFHTVSRKQAAIQQVNRLTKVNAAGDYQVSDLQKILATDGETAFLYDCYKRHCQGKRGIIYAVNRTHATMIARHFAEQGVDIAAIDSHTPANKRRTLVEGFRNGSPQVLVNVELFGEGFDCPAIEFAMLARPTKSLAMFLQQTGRTLRVNPATKSQGTAAIILDCVGLYNRFRLPEDERNWGRMFVGKKLSTELYDQPLGVEDETGGLIEIKSGKSCNLKPQTHERQRVQTYETFTRNGLCGIRYHNGIEVTAPAYKAIKQTKDGWFYGRTGKGELVIFDMNGRLVFQMQHCDVSINNDGTFHIIVTSPEGEQRKVGPFNKHMYVLDSNVKASSFGNLPMFLQQKPRLIMLEKRLSLENRFFQNAYFIRGKGQQVFLIDMFGKVHSNSHDWPKSIKGISPCSIAPSEIRSNGVDRVFRQY